MADSIEPDPVDVLLVEDDCGDAVMITEAPGESMAASNCMSSATACRR